MKTILILVLFLLGTLLIGCAHQQQSSQQSLYERIGGHDALTVIVSETIDKVAYDPKTKRSFEGIKLTTLKESIVSQLCYLTGGGCKYEGETMKNAHADAKITTAEFELMVQALRDSLNRHTGEREKNELLKILAPMKADIVYSPAS